MHANELTARPCTLNTCPGSASSVHLDSEVASGAAADERRLAMVGLRAVRPVCDEDEQPLKLDVPDPHNPA